MDSTTMIIIGVITIILIGGFIGLRLFKKKNITKLFEQIHMTSRQIPKQKKNSFILLMFMETMNNSLSKSKAAASMNKLSNPKYLEVQLIKMSKILKDTSNVTDKKTKQSLKLLNEYQTWEEAKRNAA